MEERKALGLSSVPCTRLQAEAKSFKHKCKHDRLGSDRHGADWVHVSLCIGTGRERLICKLCLEHAASPFKAKRIPAFMKPEGSLLCTKKNHWILPYTSSIQSTASLSTYLRSILILSFHLGLTTIMCTFLTFPTRDIWLTCIQVYCRCYIHVVCGNVRAATVN
jgi:hypothetical protein